VRFKALIEKYSYLQLLAIYMAAMVVVLLCSIVAFFFPIMPLCYIFNIEFSNLGPIATAAWGILFNVLILTPAFIYAIFIKIRHAIK
jgi:hypothetical protein